MIVLTAYLVEIRHDCVFANGSLHCYSAFELWGSVIFSVYLQQCIDCVLNLPLNEGQRLV